MSRRAARRWLSYFYSHQHRPQPRASEVRYVELLSLTTAVSIQWAAWYVEKYGRGARQAIAADVASGLL